MALRLPLTAAQEGVWMAQQLDPASPLCSAAEYLEIEGPIDTARFERALYQAVAEAEALHVRFVDDADGVAQVVQAPASWKLPFHLSTPAAALSWMHDDLTRVVDLECGPLFAHALFRVGADRWWWYHRAHHIALDGYGFSLIAGRVAALYNGRTTPSFGSLRDVVDQDRLYASSREREGDRAFWHRRFADRPAAVSLSDRPSPPCGRLLRRSRALPPTAMATWLEIADEAGCTWAHVVLAEIATYVLRQTGAPEVILGVPVMGRLGSRAAVTPAMVVNIVPLRVPLADGAPPHEALETVTGELERVRPHQRYRAEHLRRELSLLGGRRRLYGPVVNILPFDYGQRFGRHRAIAHNLSAGTQLLEDMAIHIHARFDGEPLIVDIDANAASYTDAELAGHLEQFTTALTAHAVPT